MEQKGWELLVQFVVALIGIILGLDPAGNITDTDLPDGEYKVVEVVDGDTIKVDQNGQTQTIRLIGIDTPELHDPRKEVECFALQATDVAEDMILGQRISLETDVSQGDKDKYDRYLRYIFLPDQTNFNEWLVANGYAYEYTYDESYRYQNRFVQAENMARESLAGLWDPGTCDGQR